MNSKAMDMYLNIVEANLVCGKARKKRIIESVSSDIYDCFEGYSDDITVDVIADRFGAPEELASSFLKDMDGTELKSKLSKKKIAIIATLIGAIISVAAIILGGKFYKRWEFFSHPDGYDVQYPVYVLETEEEVGEFEKMIGEE